MLRSLALKAIRLYAVRRNVQVHRSVQIGIGTILSATRLLTVDCETYIGKLCTIQVNGTIGRGVLIANSVGIVGRRDHDYSRIGVPVRHSPWVGDADFPRPAAESSVEIGDDVWIGFGAIIYSGVRVGRGSIVAAGAVVTKDVAPYAIVAGNPARQVAERFSGSSIQLHEDQLAQFWNERAAQTKPRRV